MCTQKPPHDYSQQLYDKYKEAFEEYINSMVRKFSRFYVYQYYSLVLIFSYGRCYLILPLVSK